MWWDRYFNSVSVFGIVEFLEFGIGIGIGIGISNQNTVGIGILLYVNFNYLLGSHGAKIQIFGREIQNVVKNSNFGTENFNF